MNKLTKTFTIKDRKYGLYLMPPVKANSLALRVFNLLSSLAKNEDAVKILGIFQKTLDEGGVEALDVEQNSTQKFIELGLPILALANELKPEKIEEIFKMVFESDIFIESEKLSDESVFHNHFQNHASDYFPVAVWAVWSNVRPFLEGAGDGLKALFKQSPIASTAPKAE